MPLIDDHTESELVNTLSPEAEVFLVRCKMKSDDYGHITGNVQALKSILYPLKDYIRIAHISRWIDECRQARLLHRYVDAESRAAIEIYNAKQRKKSMTAKFLPPEGQMPLITDYPSPQKWRPKTSEDGKKRREEKVLAHSHSAPAPDVSETGTPVGEPRPDGSHGVTSPTNNAVIPTAADIGTYAQMHGIAAESAKSFFEYYEGNDLWLNKFQRLVKWQVLLKSWAEKDRQGTKGNGNGHASFHKQTHPDRNAGTHNAGPVGKYENYAANRETKNS